MSLREEIAALREEIAQRSRATPEAPPNVRASDREDGERHHGVDAILASASSLVEDLGQDVDKFPRLSAATAFGIGLALGVVLARQVR